MIEHGKYWFHPTAASDEPLRINGVGCRELMPPGIIHRPQGTGDTLLMYFHNPVEIGVEPCGKETLIIWEPGDPHRYGNTTEPFGHSWVHLTGSLVQRFLRETSLPLRTPILLPPGPMVRGTEFLAEELTHPLCDPVILRNGVENWMRDLARHADRQMASGIPEPFAALQHYLASHFAVPHRLCDLAARTGLSASHFSGEYRRLFGTTVFTTIGRLRMEAARYCLLDRNISITEIALRVGYPDIFHFSKQFKRFYGVSPRTMRRTHAEPKINRRRP